MHFKHFCRIYTWLMDRFVHRPDHFLATRQRIYYAQKVIGFYMSTGLTR